MISERRHPLEPAEQITSERPHPLAPVEEIIRERPHPLEPTQSPASRASAPNDNKSLESTTRLLTRVVQALDQWEGADKPITPVTFHDRKDTYVTVFVMVLAISACIVDGS